MFTKILLPVSGSEESVNASNFAVRLASSCDAQIIALHVVDPSVARQMSRSLKKTPGEVEIEMEENGWRYLYYAEEVAKDSKVRIIILMERGLPQERILTKAREYNVDLIILGHSSGRGTHGMILDKSVQHILEHASCPVLIVK